MCNKKVLISKRDLLGYLYLFLSTFVTLAMVSAMQCVSEISTQYYVVTSEKIAQYVRIVQLSDLHSHIFGTDNDMLVDIVSVQQPDFIVMTGDMLDKNDENADVVCRLIRNLQEIAPVYYSHGNNEKNWMSRTGVDLNAQLTESGAMVLDMNFTDITVEGQEIRIGGYHGYYRYWGMQPRIGGEEAFADEFEDTQKFKLLLCHIPVAWLDWGGIHQFPVDLTFTGHYHGGQIRIPLIGGLYAPYIGFFPEYTEGIFEGEIGAAVLSAGLGSSGTMPRINNLPQIVVVDLFPE